MTDERVRLLAEASRPRRAHIGDARVLARLLAAAFTTDPVMDWIARRGPKRAQGLERFFFWLLASRAIPFGEVWMASSGGVAAVWLPPHIPPTAGSFLEQMRLLPMFLRLCGLPRILRGQAMGDAMERHHPRTPHFYLAFIAVAPRLQGLGLGSTILEATIERIDQHGAAAYLENSNPKNTRLYERVGFVSRGNIAPRAAPPLLAMWRQPRPKALAHQGSSSLSQ